MGSGQGQGATTSFSPSDVSITIDVSNPCKTTTITGITFNPTSITVVDGATATAEFSVPGDGVDTANSLTGLCGTKNYAISNGSGAVSNWAVITDSSVTAGDKTLTIDPSQYGSHISSTVSETLTITTTYADWGTNSGTTSTIAITITNVSCDCSALAWTAPTAATGTVQIDATDTSITVPAPTADTSARSSNAAFDACYELSTDCATTGTYASGSIKYSDGNALPSWITWNHSTQTLSINPDNPSYAGSHSLLGTYTPTYGTAAEFTVVTFTVNCVVTSFTRPSNPTSGLTYNLWSSPIAFDFS